MKRLLPVISLAALAAIVGFPIAFLVGGVDHATSNLALLIATLAWFATAPFWIRRGSPSTEPIAERDAGEGRP